MKKTILLIALLLIFGLANILHSQSDGSKIGAGLLVGGSKLFGDIEETSTSFTGGIIFRYTPFRFFAISVNSTYGTMTSGLNALKTEVFNTTLSGSFFVFPSSKYRPFLTFGLSNFHYATKDGNAHQLYYKNGRPVAGWETAFQVGFGFELFTGSQWAINTFGDYMFTRGDELDAIDQGKNDGFFRGLIGLIHYFKHSNKTKDEDKYTKSWRHIKNNLEIDEISAEKSTKIENSHQSQTTSKSSLFSNGIYFEPGSAKIHEKSKPQLHKIYRYLLANPEEEIELLAMTENERKNQPNSDIIYQRAKSVKTYLVNLGIRPSRIIINR